MKKLFSTLFAIFVFVYGHSQVVTTTPAFITESSGSIEITFDATQGTGELKDYTGIVYAHTGLITSESRNDSDWKYVVSAWGENLEKCKLISLGNNKWKFTISPSIKEFYDVPETENIKQLAFVFRSAERMGEETGSKYLEGKDLVSGVAKDILIDIFESGLNVSFSLPKGDQSIKKDESLDFIINTSATANINLLINNTIVKTETSAESLSYTHVFTSRADYVVVAQATTGTQTVSDTMYICVPKSAEYDTRPGGLQDGINYIDDSTVSFILYAPNKKNVFLVGDFNDWRLLNDYQLKKDGNYWWYTLTDLDKDKLYSFQYVVDDTIRITDPYTELVLDPSGDDYINSNYERYPNMPTYPAGKTTGYVATFQIDKPQYNWEVTDFVMPSKTNMVIYELLLRDFTKEQSLQTAIDHLDYLEKLGITAVELMPIQEFDGNNSWGYNPNHYFAPDKAYGSPELYKKFIDECHKRGIAVILDVVLNHATGSHPFAKLYWDNAKNKTAEDNPWFNVDAPHPYSVFHDFDHSQVRVREHFKRMLQYWVEEYKIDGYRLDLSKGLTQRKSDVNTAGRYDQDRINYLTEYYEAVKEKRSNFMFILEHFCDDDEERVLAEKGMYLWKNVNNAFSQSAMGYSSSSSFGAMSIQPRNWVSYAESHDEERNFYKAKTYGSGNVQTDSLARIARVPLNMAFATLIPGPKMIWQFGEIGYDVESGESESSIRMQEKPSGFQWYHNCQHRRDAYHATAKMLNMRKQYSLAFNTGNCTLNVGEGDWDNGRRIGITHADLNLVVVGNFKTSQITSSPNFPKTGTWYELLTDTELTVTNTNMTMPLQAGEVRIYTDRKIQTPELPNLPDLPSNLQNLRRDDDTLVYPTITNGKVFISTNAAIKNVSIYSLHGKLISTFSDNCTEIDLTNLSNGLYFVEIINSTGKTVHKIVKN